MRRVADRDAFLGSETVGDEAFERLAAAVDDAERRVARLGQLRCRLDQLLEEGVERELRGQRDAGVEQGSQAMLFCCLGDHPPD